VTKSPARSRYHRRMIVDAWIQHLTPRALRDPMFDSLKRWLGGELPDAIPTRWTRAALDAAEVDRALICAWEGPQGSLVSNDEVAAFVAEDPERLVGIASVDLRRPMDAVRELRRAVNDLGFRGLRILPWLWNLPPDDRRYYPLYAECVALDVPFCLQVGHAGPLCESEPGRPIPYLDRVALEFPELRIVGGHVGYPWTEEMLSLCRKYENVYLDTSAYLPKRYPPELVAYLRGGGRKKVLFGSNLPMLQPKQCLDQVEALGLDEDAQRLFLGENASRVFGL